MLHSISLQNHYQTLFDFVKKKKNTVIITAILLRRKRSVKQQTYKFYNNNIVTERIFRTILQYSCGFHR